MDVGGSHPMVSESEPRPRDGWVYDPPKNNCNKNKCYSSLGSLGFNSLRTWHALVHPLDLADQGGLRVATLNVLTMN